MNKNLPPPPYILLDSGNCRKLEQVGYIRVIRPALNAFWKPSLDESEWAKADTEFKREPGGGGGVWHWRKNLQPPAEWAVTWENIPLLIKPTNFGHLGFFAEQAENWRWLRKTIEIFTEETGHPPRTLNLFAYTGGASLAMAQAGADVCHVDASKGIIEWAKKNQALCGELPGQIRWICDDVMKFLAREKRRDSQYNGIVLDPPSFGRGSKGQVWKIEEGLHALLESCRAVMDTEHPYFILLSCHSQGFSPSSLGRCLKEVFHLRGCETEEMTIPSADIPSDYGYKKEQDPLPAGIYAREFVYRHDSHKYQMKLRNSR